MNTATRLFGGFNQPCRQSLEDFNGDISFYLIILFLAAIIIMYKYIVAEEKSKNKRELTKNILKVVIIGQLLLVAYAIATFVISEVVLSFCNASSSARDIDTSLNNIMIGILVISIVIALSFPKKLKKIIKKNK